METRVAISPDISSGPYVGNGSQTGFPFTFTALSAAEVAVDVNGVTISSGLYSVAITAAPGNGGTVTFNAAPDNGATILLRSNPDFLQDSSFENQGAYNLDTINTINRRQAVRAWFVKQLLAGSTVGQAMASAVAAAASQAAAAISAAASTASAALAGTGASTATAQATAASNSASTAVIASAVAGAYPNSAASNVPRGLTQASVGAITPGASGTNGTFALAFSGGNFSILPTGTFTVAGGVLTAVTITGPGLYIGASPTVPTVSFAASSGLTGAAVALTAQFLVAAGASYWVQSADNSELDRYSNVAGVATAVTGVGPVSINLTPASMQSAIATDFAKQFKSAIGPTANLRILADFEGPRVGYLGSTTILTELDSLDDTPIPLTVHSTISSVPNPRPIYTPGRGLFFSSQSGLQNTTTQIITGTANSWAFFGSWDLNVPLLSSTVNLQSNLAGLGGVEGDMAKVINDKRSNLTPDVLNILDQDTASAAPVNGFYINTNGAWPSTASLGYLFEFRDAAKTKYFRGKLNGLGQFYIEIYQGSGTTVYQAMSKGTVPMLGKLNIALYADRGRTMTLFVNGVRLYGRDISALPNITDLAELLLNGADRTANAVLPISAGMRHYYRGHAFVQSLPEANFMKAQEVFMRRHAAPVWVRPPALRGMINAGQSHTGGYFNITDNWVTSTGYNGTVTVPSAFDIGLRSPTREAAPNLLAHNATQLNGGQTPYADIGPFNIRAANGTGINTAECHTPTSQGEAYIMGWLKQINAHLDGASSEWISHYFTYPGITLNQLFSEPNTYLPAEYKTANIGLFELVAALKQQIILARDHARAHGQKYTCDLMNWFHGHADAKITGFTDNASYASQFLTFYDALNAWVKLVCDQTHDITVIMIPPDYSQTGLSNNTIAQCQRMIDIVNTRGTRPIYMGPNEGAFTNFIHNDPLGQRGIGEAYGLAARRVLLDGEPYVSIVPYAYTYTVGGTTIDIDYRMRPGESLVTRDSNGRNILQRQTDSGVDTFGYGYFQKSLDVTITIASPGVITWAAHGIANGSKVRLYTLGALPTGLSPGVDYFVVNATTNNFQLALTSGGAAINTSGTQSGVHTAFDTTVKISSVAVTSANRVRVTLGAPIVAGSEIQYAGFNARYGNIASNTAVAGFYKDQDFTTLVSGSPVLAESSTFNDLTLIAMSSRKVL